MSSISLFNTSSLYSTTQTATTSAPQTAAATPATTTSQEDTVKLSATAQAKQLYHQGQGVSTIAASLGTDTKTVNNYLGITLEKEIAQTLEATLKA
jgi:DNA-binding NarL/FixJ family response regulator